LGRFFQIEPTYCLEEIKSVAKKYFTGPILSFYNRIIEKAFIIENGEMYYSTETYFQNDDDEYYTDTIDIFNREDYKIEFIMNLLSLYGHMEQLICEFVYEDGKWFLSNSGYFSKITNEFYYNYW
jgi:hypothetical protein